MNLSIADAPKPEPSATLTRRGSIALRFRFFAGAAIALGGAGVLLSDLLHLMPSFG